MLVLAILALLPPAFLMWKIYKEDQVEKEPKGLIAKAAVFGAIAVIPILIVEVILDVILNFIFTPGTLLYMIIDNFLFVALVEEFFKFVAVKMAVWNNPNFNYTFDGIVYAVAASLGFAAVENIEYVFQYGTYVAVTRALTAIPGHCIFGIFMGVFLGMAKYEKFHDHDAQMTKYLKMALFVPVLIHGCYDFILSFDSGIMMILFYILLIALDIFAVKLVQKKESGDKEIFD